MKLLFYQWTFLPWVHVLCLTPQLSSSVDHIPWRSIITSRPLWAIVVAHFSYNWTFYTLLTLLPTYMNDVLGFSIQQVSWCLSWRAAGRGPGQEPLTHRAVVSAYRTACCRLCLTWAVGCLPCWVGSWPITWGKAAEFPQSKSGRSYPWSVRTAVKITKNKNTLHRGENDTVDCAGMFGPALFLVAAGYTGCNYTLAVIFLTISSTLGGVTASGWNINHLDIAPS